MSGSDRLHPRRPTVKDVARAAGVSASTVSNVLNDHPYVTDDKRERVERAISALGYRPSLVGRRLRAGRRDALALAVPDIRSPYYTDLAHVMLLESQRRGFTLFIDETNGSLEQEREIAQGYPGRGIDAVIFCPNAISGSELQALQGGTPIVLLGEHVIGVPLDHVTIDSESSAREATKHLLATGRTRLAFAGARAHEPASPAHFRLVGVRETLREHGLRLDPALLLPDAVHTREEGWRVGCRLAEQSVPFDALVCAADLLAVGAMSAFRERGLAVPDQVAVLGWDDSPEGRFTVPGLTSVAHDMATIAQSALDAVEARLADPDRPPVDITIDHRLVVRGSTAPVRADA